MNPEEFIVSLSSFFQERIYNIRNGLLKLSVNLSFVRHPNTTMNITENNYQLAYAALRDILYMFVDMVESYKGFGHNIDTGVFSPLDFIDAPIFEPPGVTFGIDVALLQNGSAIALLCELLNAWDETGSWKINSHFLYQIRKANEEHRFSHLPEIQEAFDLGFGDDEAAFLDQLQVVYKKYVCSYFEYLANRG